MGDTAPRKGITAGIIASASVGALIFVAGVFFGGMAIGYSLAQNDQPQDRPGHSRPAPERPTAKPNPRPAPTSTVLGRWHGDLEGAKPGTVELNLQTANSFLGSDGCNGGGGDWKLDGSTVHFSNARSTMKACLDIGDPYLFRAATGEVSEDGSTMELFDSEGERIGTLYRAGERTSEGDLDTDLDSEKG